MKKTKYLLFILLFGFSALTLLNSCVSERKLVYFDNIKKDTVIDIQSLNVESKISKNDILQITILSPDASINQLFVASNGQSGYLVDESGSIKLALLGDVKVEGLTKPQLSTLLTKQLVEKKFAIDPIVTVRISNYKITVLGEVARPGVVAVPSERITLTEAIANAGDLTQFAKRDSIMLIRDVGNKRTITFVSLKNTNSVFNKDVFNLQNQDIVYVRPAKTKALSTDRSSQTVSYLATAFSVLLIIYTQFIRRY